MKIAIASIPVLLVLAACKEKKASADPAAASPETSQIAAPDKAPQSWENVRSLAKLYLLEVVTEAHKVSLRDGARDSLRKQRTAGGASLKEAEFKKAEESLDKTRDGKYDAEEKLVAAEDAMPEYRKEGRHSEAINAFKKKADALYEKYIMADIAGDSDAEYNQWKTCLETTLEQIEAHKY